MADSSQLSPSSTNHTLHNQKIVIKPALFDVVELLVNLPEFQQSIGSQGSIVECHDLNHFEVELALPPIW